MDIADCHTDVLFAAAPRAHPASPSAAGAHTLLACAAAYCVRDAEVRGRSDASTFVKLRKGLRAVGVLHLLCFAAKVAFDDWSQYPAASTKPILSVASLATYAAAAAI